MINHIKAKLQNAELVLVGLGEDFDLLKSIRNDNEYIKLEESISDRWMLPFLEKILIDKRKEFMLESYNYLEKILKDKNYFIVSTCMDDIIDLSKLNTERIVKPCGGHSKLQCDKQCCKELYDVSEEIIMEIQSYVNGIRSNQNIEQPKCPYCGGPLVFNNLKAEKYIEDSYLNRWEKYMQWLQGTVNKNLCILELGVGLNYPSVIRWPFEKIVYINEKAEMYRVHERLYQITDEIKDRSYGICQSPIDFLNELSTYY